MSPEQSPEAASQDAVGDKIIDKERDLEANTADPATKKKKGPKSEPAQQYPKYSRRSI